MEAKLIKLVQGNKCLYDRREPNYRNLEVKERIWKDISEQLNTPVERIKTRWASLRDRYHRENRIRNVEGGRSSPCHWRYYQQMNFMKQIPKKNLSTTYYNKEKVDSAKSEPGEDFLITPFFKDENDKSNNNSLTEQKLAFVEEFVNCFGDTDGDEETYLEENDFIDETKPNESKDIKKINKNINSSMNNSKAEDVDDLFCKMLSASLKSLSRVNNMKAKTEIFQVLEKYVEKEENNSNIK